jgi:hypothetical protein
VGLGVLLTLQQAEAADIIVTGEVVQVSEVGDLLSELGGSRTVAYVTGTDQILLSVCNSASVSATWRVDVRRDAMDWPKGVKLEVRRTGDGLGEGSIVGRRGFVEVGTTSRTLCSGQGDRTSIPLQIRISGCPLDMDAGMHVTSITYTVVQTGR